MSKSIELMNNSSEKDALKNIADFFYDSISNFKRTLTDLSISMNYFLSSLQSIEKQLGMHGFETPENSSELLYERLTKNKEIREVKQKEFIAQLMENPVSKFDSYTSQHRKLPQPLMPPESLPIPKEIQMKPPPTPIQAIPQRKDAIKAGPVTEVTIKPALASLDRLKSEMLESLRTLKKRIKDYK